MFARSGIILFFAICLFFFSIGNYYNSDEGVILNGAWRMYNGDQLYTDFFSFVAPGSYWWTELSFNLLGPSYFSARIFSILLLAVSIFAVYRLTLLMGASWFTAIISSLAWFNINLFVPHLINYNNLSSYSASIAAMFLAAALVNNKNRDFLFLLAGFFSGATAVFLQTKGPFLILGFSVLIMGYWLYGKIYKKNLLLFFSGAVIFPAAALYVWGPAILYEFLFRWLLGQRYLEAIGSSLPLWGVVFTVFIVVLFFLLRNGNGLNKDVIAVAAVTQLALLTSVLNHPDIFHIMLASFGLVVLAAVFLSKHFIFFVKSADIDLRIFKNITLFYLFTMALVSSAGLGLGALGLEFWFKEFKTGNQINKIYAHPFLPGFYFELGLSNPYRYDHLITGLYPKEAFLDNLEKLKKEDPQYIFVDYGMVQKFGYNKANLLDSYIEGNYETASVFDTFKILKKK